MNKPKMLKIVNPIMTIVFLCLAGSGLAHDLIPYEIFHAVHGKLGFTFVLLAFTHIYLNWNWIKSQFLKKKK